MPSFDVVKVYMSLVRPIVEYACQVWHSSLTVDKSNLIESIQQRALKIAFPHMDYEDALTEAKLVTLHQRRADLCKRLFESAQEPDHKLHPLLPPPRNSQYDIRDPKEFPLPMCKTNRYKDSIVPYCLFNF